VKKHSEINSSKPLNEIKNYNLIRQKCSAKCLKHISRKDAVEFFKIAKDE